MAVAERTRPPVSPPVEEPAPYTPADFERIAAIYPDLRIELTQEGELILRPPTFTETGMRNFRLTVRFGAWSEANGLGIGSDSSTAFTLPNGAKRSPDLSWVRKSRWDALAEEEQKDFALICPDFVAELRPKTDRLSAVQEKMQEYMDNGARLGWLIDPESNRVEVYRPGQDVEVLDNPASLSGEDVLPGFTLDLKGILE